MLSKLLLLTLVPVFIIQPNAVLSNAIDHLSTAVQVAVTKLISDAKNEAEKATNETFNLLKTVQNRAQNLVDGIDPHLGVIMNDINRKINISVAFGGGIADKVESCNRSSQPLIQEFEVSAYNNVTGCVIDRVKTAIVVINDITSSVKTIRNISSTINYEIFKACPNSPNKDTTTSIGHYFCVLNIVSSATGELTATVVNIVGDISEVNSIITNLSTIEAGLNKCFSTRLAQVALNDAPIVNNIIKCTLAK